MKILMAYDGSDCSNAIFDDLRRAGLPPVAEVLVLSVAENLRPAANVPWFELAPSSGVAPCDTETMKSGGHPLDEAEKNAAHAAARLHEIFPGWRIRNEALVDIPGAAIIRKAASFEPDLILVGSHGRTGIRRMVLGSVSQTVLNRARCSVRICRQPKWGEERAIRIVIGVDGSEQSQKAVSEVARRNWPQGTSFRVAGVFDTRLSTASAATPVGAIPAEIEGNFRRAIAESVRNAAMKLAARGLNVSSFVFNGFPTEMLLEEAEKWEVDCLFVGARGISGLERLLLGSVACGVASRARCSVEVIREKHAAR
jgi:nucleotide-binding universal stress UspA family protein